MSPLPLNITLSILAPTIQWNSISLYIGCGVSTLLCTSLFYIVHVYTPPSMISRKYCLHNLLSGCAIHTLLYALTQPLPILPYRIILFTGPLRSLGSTVAGVLYALWFSDMTFIMNNAYITSLSNYIDITHGLSSSSKMFAYLRDIPLRKRLILFNVYHLQNTAIALLTVFFIYIDYEFAPVSTKDVLQSDFAMIQFKNESYTGLFIMIAFGGYVVFYIASIFYLNFYIFRRLSDLKPTISEKTYEILEKMSHLFAFVVISPVFFFHIPHLLFVVCNYYLPAIVSTPGLLEAITIITTVLYALFPFSFYVFLLIGFKQYRNAFFHLVTFRRFAIKSSPTNSRYCIIVIMAVFRIVVSSAQRKNEPITILFNSTGDSSYLKQHIGWADYNADIRVIKDNRIRVTVSLWKTRRGLSTRLCRKSCRDFGIEIADSVLTFTGKKLCCISKKDQPLSIVSNSNIIGCEITI